ncbi:MAG: YceI family protein, partial [Spirochaetia bacterium]|nr:YceI family protein [Spirochaetia bacterium]
IAVAGEVRAEGGGKACEYSYDPAATKITWTAFKFTEKFPVSGTFTSLKVTSKPAPSIELLGAGISFEIEANSVTSGVAFRDDSLRRFFFAGLKNGEVISGTFKPGKAAGTARLMLRLNGLEKEVPVTYTVTEPGRVQLAGSIELTEWDAAAALAALNKRCEGMHRGKDGSSILWPTIQFRVESTFKRTCR